MQLISRVFDPNETAYYFVVDLDSDYREKLLWFSTEVARLKNTVDNMVFAVELWDSRGVWYDTAQDEQALEDLLYSKDVEWAILTDEEAASLVGDVDPVRTETGLLVIDDVDVYWTARPKHGDHTMETRLVPVKALAAAVL